MTPRRFLNLAPNASWDRNAAQVVIWTRKGKLNCTGELTLTPNAASTTLTDELIGVDSTILLSPMTANAAAALGTTWFSTPIKGSVTINHANSAQTDRTFRFSIIG